MPMPIPKSGESKEEFVSRFMADDKMIEEFPDDNQRMAIAVKQFESFGELKKDVNIFELNQEINKLKNEQWILVFPIGKHYIQKYDTSIEMENKFFAQIDEAFNSETLSKPFIDKDHEFAESFGDILESRITERGMEFKVRFNKKGMESIQGNEYSYISPAWGTVTDTLGNKFVKLMAISLVNFPAFEGVLPTLQSQLAASKFGDKVEYNLVLNKNTKKENIMDMKMLAKEFDLAPEASIESILDEVVKLKKYNEDTAVKVVELSKELEASKENENIALTKVQEMGEKLSKIESAELEAEANKFVEDAVKLGKMHPTQIELMKEKYMTDKEFVIALLDKMPAIEDSQKSQTQAGDSKIVLSKEEEKAMIKAGMDINDPEEVKAFKEF